MLADVDAGRISTQDFFARAEELLKERCPKPAPAHKPAQPSAVVPDPGAPLVEVRPPTAPETAGGVATA